MMRLTTHATPPKRRFVDRSPSSTWWQGLHRVADKHFPSLRRLFTDAWDAVREAVDWEALGTALREGNLPAILVLLEEAWATSADATLRDPLRTTMQTIVAQGARASQPALTALLRPTTPGLAITFDEASPQVLAFVREHSGELIRNVGIETRQAIRALLVQNMQAGRSWRSLVPEVRSVIGVTVRQADALVARRTLLLSQGMKEAAVDKVIDAKARQYKRVRARTVARNEALMAANAGQHAMISQLVTDGVMDTTQYRRFVVTTPDERQCPVCKEIKAQHPEGVGLLEPFRTPNGPVMHPPYHVLCRCATTVRRVRSI